LQTLSLQPSKFNIEAHLMTRLQLVTFTENIPLNNKNSMRHAKKSLSPMCQVI